MSRALSVLVLASITLVVAADPVAVPGGHPSLQQEVSSGGLEAFELAERLADAALAGGAASRRAEAYRALAEAVRLDERLAASALRVAIGLEREESRRAPLRRMLEGLDGPGRSGEAAVAEGAIELSWFMARFRRGDDREARRLAELPSVSRRLSASTFIDGGRFRIERELSEPGPPVLGETDRRNTLEFELAWLRPGRAGLGLSRWLDDDQPLPEVDAEGLARWFDQVAASIDR